MQGLATGTIVLAAGGTGGHMFPAEALARELLERGLAVALVTDRRGEAFGELPGVVTHRIRAARLGAGVMDKVIGAAELLMGTVQAGALLRRLAAAVVVGFGGYPSVPTVYAAGRLGIPTVLHEQNAILGRANRLLAPRARSIATGFTEIGMMREADRARAVYTGNPVRPAIAGLADYPYVAPGEDGPFNLLVIGGSQGARIFSDVLPPALSELPERLRRRIQIAQQARPEDLDRVREAYAKTGVAAETQSFFDDIPARLAEAHLVIGRAGASTSAELTAAGRPAILVPYPHAMDDHQTANAAALAAAGAAWVMPQDELTPRALAQRLAELARQPERLAAAADAARRLGRPDAASRLADLVLEAAANDASHRSAA